MLDFKTILSTALLVTQFGMAATSEQVEQYLSASQSEEIILSMQSQFSAMQNSFSQESNSSKSLYDTQMISIRFRDYLERNISDDEMADILDNYRNVALMHFVNASTQAQTHTQTETKNYILKLQADPEATVRIALIDKISEKFYPKEGMIEMFDNLMKPLIQNGIGGEKISEEMLKSYRDNYIKRMLIAAKEETLFATRDFELKELEELMKIAKTSAVNHESKAVYGAMAYALKDFFQSMVSRYDVSKHQPKQSKTAENKSK